MNSDSKRIAICPGSFDPITLGHLNIIRRSAQIFDEVVVCIMQNSTKTSPMFSIDERVEMVRRAIVRYPNVRVDTASILLAEYARQFKHAVIVKGLRAASDFEYEFQMNLINKKINPELETMFLTSSEKYTFLSSSVVREMAMYGADLTGLVPVELIPDIEKKAKLWRKT
ncbi:MAG: pantetheine-phosphate adenylyltransferase [Oscillospiraceae bacterium]|nr:pantetheine-phosphate adenylyltransferase [Oscillospiraceae bacterium]